MSSSSSSPLASMVSCPSSADKAGHGCCFLSSGVPSVRPLHSFLVFWNLLVQVSLFFFFGGFCWSLSFLLHRLLSPRHLLFTVSSSQQSSFWSIHNSSRISPFSTFSSSAFAVRFTFLHLVQREQQQQHSTSIQQRKYRGWALSTEGHIWLGRDSTLWAWRWKAVMKGPGQV